MSPLIETPSRITFGLFEADLESGELWKAGKRIKIQSQPFKILAALLEHPGEVVTREELQLRLWGKDTTVDFDHSLGTAVNKIREALGDSADNPRFVETLARRGYRFIAPVSYPSPPPMEPAPAEPSSLAEDVPDSVSAPVREIQQDPLTASEPPLSRRSSPYLFAGVGVLLAVSGAGLGFYLGNIRGSSREPVRISQVTRTGRISPGAASMENLPATATDGYRIFSPVIEKGRPVLSQISLADGDPIPLEIPSEITGPSIGDLSPDGTRLLVRSHLSPESEQPLWVVPVGGGSALRVSNILAHDATWMPDGQGILYAAGNELLLTHLRDGSSTPMAGLPGRAFWLRWSPDGKLLRFTIIDPIAHTLSLWELVNGSRTPHPILKGWSNPAADCCGTWTSDGKFFVFQSSRDGNDDLWMLRGNQTLRPIRVTNGPLRYQAPIAARTGHRIFFLGLDTQSELLRYSAEKHEFSAENNFLSPASRVTFSRDRQWVAWTDTQGRLWRARLNGDEKLQLTPDSMQVFLAHWSPDGRQLALMAREPGQAWQLYSVAADGSSPKRLLDENRNAADPDWSSDGQSLVFGRVPDLMGKESGTRAIQLLDLRTHAVTTLPGSEGLFSPRWSPDGRFIVAITLDQRRLMLYNIATRSWTQLSDSSAADPVWSPDSRAVYIHAFMSPNQPIDRIDVSDGRLQQVADLSSFRSDQTADYFFSGITPDDVPLVRARSSTANLYSLDIDGR